MALVSRQRLWRSAAQPAAWVLGTSALAWAAMAPHMVGAGASCHEVYPALGNELGNWTLMVVAMMLPLTLPGVRFVVSRVPRRRRTATALLFVGGYLLPWLALALPAVGLVQLAWPHGTLGGAAAFAAAAAWSLGPIRRRALWTCHATAPIGVRGPRWWRGVGGLGLRHGRACLVGCGPAMLACALTGHSALAMIVGCVVGVWERRPVPLRSRQVALIFAGLSLIFLLEGLP